MAAERDDEDDIDKRRQELDEGMAVMHGAFSARELLERVYFLNFALHIGHAVTPPDRVIMRVLKTAGQIKTGGLLGVK